MERRSLLKASLALAGLPLLSRIALAQETVNTARAFLDSIRLLTVFEVPSFADRSANRTNSAI